MFVAAVMRIVDIVDYPAHIAIASRCSWKGLLHNPIGEICYPIWHILTWLTMRILGCSGRLAAAVVTAICLLGTWAWAAWCLSKRYGKDGAGIAPVASVCLMLVMAIWLPFFNPNIVLGQGAPNVLHNPTNIMVRLIAFPCFVCYASIMDGIGKTSRSCVGAYKISGLQRFLWKRAA